MLILEYNQLQAESKQDWEFLDSCTLYHYLVSLEPNSIVHTNSHSIKNCSMDERFSQQSIQPQEKKRKSFDAG